MKIVSVAKDWDRWVPEFDSDRKVLHYIWKDRWMSAVEIGFVDDRQLISISDFDEDGKAVIQINLKRWGQMHRATMTITVGVTFWWDGERGRPPA